MKINNGITTQNTTDKIIFSFNVASAPNHIANRLAGTAIAQKIVKIFLNTSKESILSPL